MQITRKQENGRVYKVKRIGCLSSPAPPLSFKRVHAELLSSECMLGSTVRKQVDGHTNRRTDRQTDRPCNTDTDIITYWNTHTHTHTHTHAQTPHTKTTSKQTLENVKSTYLILCWRRRRKLRKEERMRMKRGWWWCCSESSSTVLVTSRKHSSRMGRRLGGRGEEDLVSIKMHSLYKKQNLVSKILFTMQAIKVTVCG
jgi:hypothetical protein